MVTLRESAAAPVAAAQAAFLRGALERHIRRVFVVVARRRVPALLDALAHGRLAEARR